jgi:uncharacterized protein YecE (DUF72 family)
MPLLTGTSGFDYPHWRGPFYPRSLPAAGRLAFYAARFPCVELNSPFYRLPAGETFRRWAEQVPDGFTFAVKASRYLTHVKRLDEPEDAVNRLLERARLLGGHLGPILLQLPPTMTVELDRLGRTLDAFGGVKVAVEFRHSSWFTPEVMTVLRSHGAALCLADRGGPQTPLWRTAGWTYLRFHEGRSRPLPCYGESALRAWIERLGHLELAGEAAAGSAGRPQALDGFAFFNNDAGACAVRDAGDFARLLSLASAARTEAASV